MKFSFSQIYPVSSIGEENVQGIHHQRTLVFFESTQALLAGADSHHTVAAERSYYLRTDLGHLALHLYHFLTTNLFPDFFHGTDAIFRRKNGFTI